MRKPRSKEGKINMKLAQNRPERLEKSRKPKSEETIKNMKIAQQKRRDKEKGILND